MDGGMLASSHPSALRSSTRYRGVSAKGRFYNPRSLFCGWSHGFATPMSFMGTLGIHCAKVLGYRTKPWQTTWLSSRALG
jgi:hypothetical protein